MQLISKLATSLISPLGSSLVLMLLVFFLFALGRRRWALIFGSVAFIWLWVWSLPIVSSALAAQIEAKYPIVPVQSLPSAQAIVVLGGAMNAAMPENRFPDLNEASDRVWHAARIYRANKAPILLLSGGSDLNISLTSEAQAMRELLLDLGVPDTVMVLERNSRNTRENARFSAAILEQHGLQQILLVTSALHMHRASTCFESTGLQVTAAATDHTVITTSGLLSWLPDATALETSARALKEIIGLLVWYWFGQC